jgi:hypothetical protein
MNGLPPAPTPVAVAPAPRPAPGGSLRTAVERGTGIVQVVGRGSWTPAAADRHFAELEQLLLHARQGGLGALAMIDLRLAGEEGPETQARTAHWTRTLYRPGDRIAILVASCLQKSRMRRLTLAGDCQLFLSESAARAWLLAYTH